LDAKKELSDEEAGQLELLKSQIIEQETIIAIEESKRDLGVERIKNETLLLELAERISRRNEKDLSTSKKLLQIQNQIAFAKAGGTGTSGNIRGQEISTLTLAALQEQRQKALTAQDNAFDNFIANSSDRGDNFNNAVAQLDKADARVEKIENEIDVYKRRAEILVLNTKAQTELLQTQISEVSLNPAMTAYNKAVNEAKLKGIELTLEHKAQLFAEIEAQTMLTTILENKTKLFEGIASSISSAFTSIVTGTASAKEAFKSMAISILSQISQMIIQMMVMRMLMSFFAGPMAPVGGASSIHSDSSMRPSPLGGFMHQSNPLLTNGPRNGGVFSQGKRMQGYATGGVAKGSTSGYPAMLHGTEAVVPLPNGRSIPVELKDSGSTNNNIVVNVSTDGQTNKQGSTGPDMDKLGSAIAAAVQTELQNQKRSGGILNPYGVA
jgi:hypothetical protein